MKQNNNDEIINFQLYVDHAQIPDNPLTNAKEPLNEEVL